MSVKDLARPEIAALNPYAAAAQVDDTIRLNANESPEANGVDRFRRPLNRYPEIRPQRLQAAMAERFACDPEQLLVTRGSSEAIDLLIRTFCRAGKDNLVIQSPSFSMYRHYATIQGAEVIEVPTSADQDFTVSSEQLIDARNTNTRLVFVCSPNNPTGTSMPREDLLALLDACRNKSVVVVDEAYIEFGAQASAVELIDRFENLVVLRTLSKALGFAGVRCGAVIAATSVTRMLDAVQAPYALATPVVECVEDALTDTQLSTARAVVAGIIEERARMSAALEALPFVLKVWPSDANFVLMRTEDAPGVMAACRRRNVLIRGFDGVLSDCLRITIGSRSDNDQLLGALSTITGTRA